MGFSAGTASALQLNAQNSAKRLTKKHLGLAAARRPPTSALPRLTRPASYDDVLRLKTLSSLRKVRGEYSDAEVDELISGIPANPANNLVGGCSVEQYTIGPCTESPQGIYGVMDFRPQNLATTPRDAPDCGAGTRRANLPRTDRDAESRLGTQLW
jgi:hypothetical protein